MSKPQPSFPSYNRTPKHFGSLNNLHPNPRNEFRTFWGRVEELLVAEELWNDHKKLIFFPVASAATCTDSHLKVDQSSRDVTLGVLRLVPEQYLRISLPKGTVPLMDPYTCSRIWSSLHNPKRNYNTLGTTRCSFYAKGIHTLELPGLPSTRREERNTRMWK
ncbi:hypothetical protein Taro_025228 [Colocasia esculenta]|uniref:Uncharacterized protein n=1 Tax=Colocasia esculenta TaxID=4460 RepID=A0A843VGZ0_COLES|nr:hypothetical protein [Colocasia esculenta]